MRKSDIEALRKLLEPLVGREIVLHLRVMVPQMVAPGAMGHGPAQIKGEVVQAGERCATLQGSVRQPDGTVVSAVQHILYADMLWVAEIGAVAGLPPVRIVPISH